MDKKRSGAALYKAAPELKEKWDESSFDHSGVVISYLPKTSLIGIII